jgi:hypothetical protein
MLWLALSPSPFHAAGTPGTALAPRAATNVAEYGTPRRRLSSGTEGRSRRGWRRASPRMDGVVQSCLTGCRKTRFPPGCSKRSRCKTARDARGTHRRWVGGVLSPYVAAPRERAGYPSGGWVPQMGLFQQPAKSRRPAWVGALRAVKRLGSRRSRCPATVDHPAFRGESGSVHPPRAAR